MLTEEAKKARVIGASSGAAVLGLNKYGCARAESYRLKNKFQDLYVESDSYHIKRGNMFEQMALEYFSKEIGVALTPNDKVLVHPDYPFITDIPDAFGEQDGVKFAVEVKCPSNYGYYNRRTEEFPSIHYLVQCQHHLLVTGFEYCYLVEFFTEYVDAIVTRIDRDEVMIKEMVEIYSAFWDNLQKDIYPKTLDITDERCKSCCYSHICHKNLRELLADNMDSIAEKDEELDRIVSDYVDSAENENRWGKRAKKYKKQILEKLGPNTEISGEETRVYRKKSKNGAVSFAITINGKTWRVGDGQ